MVEADSFETYVSRSGQHTKQLDRGEGDWQTVPRKDESDQENGANKAVSGVQDTVDILRKFAALFQTFTKYLASCIRHASVTRGRTHME